MSNDIPSIRRALASVPSEIKKGKFLFAVQTVRAAVRAMLSTPLIRNEQEEFAQMVTDACQQLNNNKTIRQLFPLVIEYSPGNEAELAKTLQELFLALEAETTKDISLGTTPQAVPLQSSESSIGPVDPLQQGKDELEKGAYDEARTIFTGLIEQSPEDTQLIITIGDSYMQHDLNEDAMQCFTRAATIEPGSAHILNRLGIALRKMKRFDVAEGKFQAALELEPNDPNLYFNTGRLYLDWQKWDAAIANATAALALAPQFREAAKMKSYAEKKLVE